MNIKAKSAPTTIIRIANNNVPVNIVRVLPLDRYHTLYETHQTPYLHLVELLSVSCVSNHESQYGLLDKCIQAYVGSSGQTPVKA